MPKEPELKEMKIYVGELPMANKICTQLEWDDKWSIFCYTLLNGVVIPSNLYTGIETSMSMVSSLPLTNKQNTHVYSVRGSNGISP